MKSTLPVTLEKHKAKIDPSVILSWSLYKILESFNKDFALSNLKFIIKFGFDGGQTLQEINFQDDEDIDDKCSFIVGLVLLMVFEGSTLIWKNKNANSVKEFKPFELLFVKENDKLSNSIFR